MLAGRNQQIENVLRALDNGNGDPNRATLFTGARGSGKTVIMEQIAFEASPKGWITASVDALPGMLDEIIEQVKRNSAHLIDDKTRSRLTAFQIGNLSLTREFEPSRLPSWRIQMSELLDALAEKHVGLLFTIDEVQDATPELIKFVSDYQHLVREDQNVALLMSGLPGNIDTLLLNKHITFLRRALRENLDEIALPDVRSAMRRTFEESGKHIPESILDILAESTDGFALMVQLVGFYTWQASVNPEITLKNAEAGIKEAKAKFIIMMLESTVAELTDKERSFLIAMLPGKAPAVMGEIAQAMGSTTTMISTTRRKLIRLGVITPAGFGRVRFAIPGLAEYLSLYH
jgi:predicted transcriptional regulator